MTLSTTSILSLLLLSLASLRSATAATPCHICGSAGNTLMAYPHVILSNEGKTCTQISLEVAMNTPFGSSQCSAKQNQWKGRCCTPGQRPSGRDPPPGLPPQNVPAGIKWVGPHPACHVCRDGDYPFATSMVINFLYIGEGSCAQYYKYGLEGRIQQHMCDPVKFFSYEPCGCGEFNPYFNPNHPLNQQAQQAPGNNGNGNGNNNGNNGNSPQQQRDPGRDQDGKGCVKMSNAYGGSGGVGCGGQRKLRTGTKGLKGAKYDSVATVVEVEEEA